jgi:hypothetical protein
MVLSAAAKAARATIAAAIKRKKANIASKRKKYPGLEKKFRDDNLKKNLQKARNQRHGQTHRQLTGPRPVTSGGQTGVGRTKYDPFGYNISDIKAKEMGALRGGNKYSPKLTRFTESYAKNKVAWGVIDQFGNKKIRGIGPKAPAGYDKPIGNFKRMTDSDLINYWKNPPDSYGIR